ncbi:hypothetical protein ACFLRG_03180 [Bacteroidota bacterium]
MDENEEDIKLLYEAPEKFIIKYQSLIGFIVNSYVINGFFNRSDADDHIQSINESLLKKINKIQDQYNYKTKIKTYFSVIVRNNCKEIIRKTTLKFVDIEKVENLSYVVSEPINNIVLKQEFDKLNKILMMFNRQRHKLELCLKLIYNIPVKFKDFKNYNSLFEKTSYLEIMKNINPGTELRKKMIYNILAPYFNRFENKNNSGDALRKWLGFKIKEVINILNGDPPVSSYNEESFQILLEKYYCDSTKDEKDEK